MPPINIFYKFRAWAIKAIPAMIFTAPERQVRPEVEMIIAANELVRRINRCDTMEGMKKIIEAHKAFEAKFHNEKGCYKQLVELWDMINMKTRLIRLKLYKVQ